MVRKLVFLAFALGLTACSSISSMMTTRPPAMVSNGVLVGPGGMTLYTFDRDVAGTGKSACLGPCATNWPPLMATPDAKPVGDWTILTRDDSTRQWAFKGQPLYYWSKDAKPGDRTGDGFNNLWKLARP
jgi:predicted lipoprotein with Yx(FWY)xxD motif